MSLPASELQDLEQALSDRLYIQINGWHLYLGDAKLARPLAIECSARIDESAALAARKALEAVAVPVAGGGQPTTAGTVDSSCPAAGPRRDSRDLLPIRLQRDRTTVIC